MVVLIGPLLFRQERVPLAVRLGRVSCRREHFGSCRYARGAHVHSVSDEITPGPTRDTPNRGRDPRDSYLDLPTSGRLSCRCCFPSPCPGRRAHGQDAFAAGPPSLARRYEQDRLVRTVVSHHLDRDGHRDQVCRRQRGDHGAGLRPPNPELERAHRGGHTGGVDDGRSPPGWATARRWTPEPEVDGWIRAHNDALASETDSLATGAATPDLEQVVTYSN